MNTGKQINAMVVVVLLTVIAVGAYALFDDTRADKAEDDQLEAAAERGAHTFALNCRLCHGDRGEGGPAGGRLPAAPALDRDSLQGIEDGAFSMGAFGDAFTLVTNTIMCGRAGTAMPTWGRDHGGTLSDEQIRQLAIVITGADVGASPYHEGGFWDLAQEQADEIDAESTEHATLVGALGANDSELTVSNAGPFSLGQYIRIDDERMRVLDSMVEVQRAAGGTEAAGHDTGATIFRVGAGGQPTKILSPSETDLDPGRTLGEAVDDEKTSIIVDRVKELAVGDVIQIDDERMEITGFALGIPETGHVVAQDNVGREPTEFLVSGSSGIEAGMTIRIESELMNVLAVRDNGDPGITLNMDASASDGRVSVSDASYFSEGYVFRVDDEWMEVVGPVDTSQTLGDTIGRANTQFTLSGTEGLSEGMVIRMGRELMRITSLTSASVTIERGAQDLAADATTAAPHPAGTEVLKLVEVDEDGQPVEDPRTGQTLLEGINSEATSMTVSGTGGIALDDSFQLGDEVVLVTDIEPAIVTVERAVDGSEAAFHSRRVPIFEGNLLTVQRGAQGTSAAAHSADTDVFLSELEVERAVDGSELQDHSKNSPIFLGNTLVVERGLLMTDAADHADGTLVYNFPPPPDAPAITGATCGQPAPEIPPTPSGPTPTPVEGATQVDVSLLEFEVSPDPVSAGAGPVQFQVVNDGTIVHNLRVIATDLAPDALPVSASQVDESSVDVMASSGNLQAGDQEGVFADLAAGSYVLICNVPTHYESGMYVAFEVQ